MSAQQATIELLDAAGEFVSKIARVMPGAVGYALMGISAAAKAIAKTMRDRGESLDEVLLRIRDPRPVEFPWDKKDSPTSQETPRAKKKET